MKAIYLMIPIALLLMATPIRAQETRSPWHSVQGLVVDEMGRPTALATVYLKDTGGHRLRMKQTDHNGRFDFGLINIDNKYEIYAEEAGLTSQKLPIVTTPSKREIVLRLVLKTTGKAPATLRKRVLTPLGSSSLLR
jgi:hypothetical protein